MNRKTTSERTARAQAASLLKRIRALGPMLKASVTPRRFRCGKPGCACANGRPHRDLVVTRKRHGKTQTVRVRNGREAEALQWLENWRRLKTLLDQLTDLQIDILRSSPPADDKPLGAEARKR